MAWKNENALLRKERVKDKSWFTRVKSWWNNLLNPDHDWLDYDAAPDSLNSKFDNFVRSAKDSIGEFTDTLLNPGTMTSLVNSWTGAGPTGQQIWANETQMQNAEDIYQRQVTGMQKAGLNPALMYQNGAAGNAPTVQGQIGSANMSDLLQGFLLDKQRKLLDAQTRNVDADTEKKASETEYQKLVNEYFPGMKSVEIDKILSEIGVNENTISKLKSEVSSIDLDAELKRIEKVIKKAESDESSAYYKAVREFQEASTEKVRQEKKKLVEETAMAVLEKEFMQNTNTKMGSAQIIALAAGIGTLMSNAFGESDGTAGWNPEMLTESLKRDIQKLLDWINKPKTIF